MYLIFDTETTGLPKRWDAPITDINNWPRCVQIAWQLHDEMGKIIEHQDYLIQPEGFNIPYDAERIHGISTELAQADGIALSEVLEKFNIALSKAKFIVGQNLNFDVNIMGCEFHRMGVTSPMSSMPVLDTCTEVTASLLKLPGGRGGKFKLPTLTELHSYLFNKPFSEAHNATADVEATTRCFLELIRREVFTKEQLDVPAGYFQDFTNYNTGEIQLIGLKHINLKEISDAKKIELKQNEKSLNTSIKTGFVEDKEFEELIFDAYKYFLSKKLKSGLVIISGFKLSKDHKGEKHMMMQLIQFRELEKKENSELMRLSFLSNEDYKDGIQRRALKVWIKITVRGFEKIFGNVGGKMDVVEIFNKLHKNSGILGCFCKVNEIFVDGKTVIPSISITQISDKNDYPKKLYNAIQRVNKNLFDRGWCSNNYNEWDFPDDLFLQMVSRESEFDNIDEILIKQSVMKTMYDNKVRDSERRVVFEILNLDYGQVKDVIVEDKFFYNPDDRIHDFFMNTRRDDIYD